MSFPLRHPRQQYGTLSVLVWQSYSMHTTANGKLQADAVAATLADAVCACRVYVWMNVCVCVCVCARVRVCLSGATEVMVGGGGRVGV